MLTLAIAAAVPAAARAQDREPLPRIAADVRATFPKFPQEESVATALGVSTENLPGRGLGFALGLNVYPARLGKVTLGLGAEYQQSGGKKTIKPDETNLPDGPTVKSTFTAFAPNVSLNFGGRDGWSYVSGGIAWTEMTIEREAAPVAESPGSQSAIHYGGGARWFMKEHLAFSFDIRFYRLPAQDAIPGTPASPGIPATPGRPAYPKGRMLVLSAGISVK